MSKRTRKTNPPQQSVPHPPSDWKTRAIAAVKRRDQNELEIAAALREGLEQLKETKWLAFCEQTWGWSRSTAYNHLNPALLAKDRARKHEANVQNSGHEESVAERNARARAEGNARETARLAAQAAAVKAGRHWTDIKPSDWILAAAAKPIDEPVKDSCSLAPGKVEISASKRGKRGRIDFAVAWDEPDGGGGIKSGYRTLDEAMTFCPCSFDPEEVERVVIPGVWVQHPIPRNMLGHGGGYRIDENGDKVPGSEIASAFRPYTDEDEPEEFKEPEPKKSRGSEATQTFRQKAVDDLLANISEELVVIEHADLDTSQIDALVALSKRIGAVIDDNNARLWGTRA